MTNEDILARMMAQKAAGHCCAGGGSHCWHLKRGAIWMVVKDGHVIQECCKCPQTRSIHGDHAFEDRRGHGDDFKLYADDSTDPRPTPRWISTPRTRFRC